MAIKYEIHSIHNSKGEGGEQKFVRLRDHEPMTSKQIEEHYRAGLFAYQS